MSAAAGEARATAGRRTGGEAAHGIQTRTAAAAALIKMYAGATPVCDVESSQRRRGANVPLRCDHFSSSAAICGA